jgi:hypothetical protein
MTTKPVGNSPVAWLTDDEAVEFFDRNARELLGISGEEFLRRWDRGDYRGIEDDDERIISLAMLIPFGRRHSS